MSTDLDHCFRMFQELEAQRTETVRELQEWSPKRVSFRPAPGAWSASEVLDHIARAESGTITSVRAGIANPQIISSNDRPGIAALHSALRSNKSFQIPPGAGAIHPDATVTLREVATRWEQTREELNRLLEQLEPEQVSAGVFCHPFAGWMTVPDVLDHFSDHLYHHGFQLARLREASVHLQS